MKPSLSRAMAPEPSTAARRRPRTPARADVLGALGPDGLPARRRAAELWARRPRRDPGRRRARSVVPRGHGGDRRLRAAARGLPDVGTARLHALTMADAFTPEERAALAPYFTSLDGPVFALANLPEAVKGALFARYSRSPKSLRRLFLDAVMDDVGGGGGAA